MKTVAIIQSNYIPWKGYFNIIDRVDEFVLLDDVQYTRRDWRNRNLIKTKNGLKWLSIPVEVKGQFSTKIMDVQVAGSEWRKDHWNLIRESYRHAPYFGEFSPEFEEWYLSNKLTRLSEINLSLIKILNKHLGIHTRLSWSMDYQAPEGKSERLLHICKALKATDYVSGRAAEGYLDVKLFNENGINVRWADYSGYREYDQLYPPFEHGVSVIDLLFHVGSEARTHFKSTLWQ